MDDGILYAAMGAPFVAEARQSAATLKRHNPSLPITLFTDIPVTSPHFDNVILTDPSHHPKVARIEALLKSPYDRTLYLDTDTFICGSLAEVFSLLDAYEFAIMPAPRRLREGDLQALGQFMCQIPLAFPQLNCGIMLYRRCPNVDQLLAHWLPLYQRDLDAVRESGYRDPKYQGIGDQAAFREAFYASPVRWMALPSEYNCIAVLPGYLCDEVKILHGRYRDPLLVAHALNARLGPRVHSFTSRKITLAYDDGTRQSSPTKPRRTPALARQLVRGFAGLFS